MRTRTILIMGVWAMLASCSDEKGPEVGPDTLSCKLKERMSFKQGKVVSGVAYWYDSKGRISQVDYLDSNHNITGVGTYFYDPEGRLIKFQDPYDQIIYSYQGKMRSRLRIRSNGDTSRVFTTMHLDQTDTVWVINTGDQLPRYQLVVYYEGGNMVRETVYFDYEPDGTYDVSQEWSYEHDDRPNTYTGIPELFYAQRDKNNPTRAYMEGSLQNELMYAYNENGYLLTQSDGGDYSSQYAYDCQ